MINRILCLGCAVSLHLLVSGCTTTGTSNTARTGMEQLLISNAVDQALSKYNFQGLAGAKVFIDNQYLEGVDKGYILGSLRDRALQHGVRLVAKAEEADIVMEVRSGGVGTDSTETYVGMPGIAIPGPMPVELPEVRVWNRSSQLGTAKLGIVAYDVKQGHLIDFGGFSLARSDDTNWFLLGIGPFQNGTVREEVSLATNAEPTTYDRVSFRSQPVADERGPVMR